MDRKEILIRAQREIWNDTISISMANRKPGIGVLLIAQPITFNEQPEGQYVEPCLRLEYTEAQRLMDELWNCGLRPSEGTGSAGSLKATQTHLADMQKIAFKLLDDKGA
jgi:hypothetical protein